MASRDDRSPKPDNNSKPTSKKGTVVIDARLGEAMARTVGDAIERQPGRATELLRAWMRQKH